jgi:hypothetical protein
MVQDYIEEFKKSYNKYDYAITKNRFCDKCVYEATGKEVEELKHRVEAEEVKNVMKIKTENASVTSANLTPLVRMWISTSDLEESIEVLSGFVRS